MKILWFTNVPFPEAAAAAGLRPHIGCGWLSALGRALVEDMNVDLHVVSFSPSTQDHHVRQGGIAHTIVGIPARRYYPELWFSPSPATRRKCRTVVEEFGPAVLHVHGTEYTLGLIALDEAHGTPMVVSLQGLTAAIGRHLSFGVELPDIVRSLSLRDLVRHDNMLAVRKAFARRGNATERRILASDAVFLGRTRFDEACLRAVNANAVYAYCDELAHPVFYETPRDARQVERNTIFTSANVMAPWKGMHCLIRAIAILAREYPELRVRHSGSPFSQGWKATNYQRYASGLAERLGVGSRFQAMGAQSPESVASEMARAHVFVSASYADNSPTSITEAMLVGTPIVAAFAGGIPSRVRDNETALCFPVGDEIVLAQCLRELLTRDEVAHRLAQTAQEVAIHRSSRAQVVEGVMKVYELAVARRADGGRRATQQATPAARQL